jgi:oligopeptide transport system substrate-binding protein
MAVPGYEADELDVAIVPPAELDRILEDETMSQELRQLPISGATILIFDTKNPPTDDVRVRQALHQAIDRVTLAEQVLRGAYQPAISFSPPDLASHNPDTFLPYDPQQAQQLLADAGYPGGEGFPEIELVYWSPERASLSCQAIAAMWKQNLGIDVTLTPLEPQAMRDYRVSRETESFNVYYALNWSGISDPSEFHNAQLMPDANGRHSRYDDPEYVQLITDAMSEPDMATRVEMYQEAEAMINRDVPIVPLVYEGRMWLVKPYVVNFPDVTTPVAEMTRVASPPGLDILQ